MPRNKKYAKAPENLGKSTITSFVITKEIMLESNPSKIAQFYSDNKGYLDKAEKYYLYDQYQNAKHIEYLKQSKQYVQTKQQTLKEENGTVELPDITLNRKQDTGLGCWSCAYELLLQSKGIKLDQKNIRSYRPNVSSNISKDDVMGLLADYVFSIPEMADLTMDVLPNTTVRSKKFTAELGQLGSDEEYNKNINKLAKDLSDSLRDVIKNQKTPVAITDNYHYITVVGVDDKGNLLCKDSIGTNNDPNHTYTYNPLDIVKRSINTAQKNHTGVMSIQMTHLEDIKLEGDKIKNFEGTSFENRVEYKNGNAVVDRDNDPSAATVEDGLERYATNVNGQTLGYKHNEGVFSVVESAYIPETLTKIQPEPTNEVEDINAIDETEAAIFNDIFDLQKDVQQEEPLEQGKAKNGKILEGKYEYVHFGSMSKDEQRDFARRLTEVVNDKMVNYLNANNIYPKYACINDNVAEKLQTFNTEIENSIKSGDRISNKAITALRDFLGAVELVNIIKPKGFEEDEKLLNDVNSLSAKDLDGLINKLGGSKQIQNLLIGVINNKREILNVIKSPSKYVGNLIADNEYDGYRDLMSEWVTSKPWKEPVQAEKQAQPMPQQPMQQQPKQQPMQQQPMQQPPMQFYTNAQYAMQVYNQYVQNESAQLNFRIKENLSNSIKELKAAKTIVNSDQYKEIIYYMSEFDKMPGHMISKLSTLGRLIDNYLDHKAHDGVKPNVFKKLAAVQKTNDWLSRSLSQAQILARTPQNQQVVRYSQYGDAFNAFVNRGGNIFNCPHPNQLQANVYANVVNGMSEVTNKRGAMEIVSAVDNCMCMISLRAFPHQRAAINQVRNEMIQTPKPANLKQADHQQQSYVL